MKKSQELAEIQNMGKKAVFIFIAISLAYFAVMAMNSYFGLADDNIFEENIEAIIEGTTGADIDLTP